jgi:hypothetical protein
MPPLRRNILLPVLVYYTSLVYIGHSSSNSTSFSSTRTLRQMTLKMVCIANKNNESSEVPTSYYTNHF